jgi:hypothetical protein
MDSTIKLKFMKTLKDKMITSSVRYTKVEFHNKKFRRFHYSWKGQTVDILWLASDREFLPESLEHKLEKEFQEKVG